MHEYTDGGDKQTDLPITKCFVSFNHGNEKVEAKRLNGGTNQV